MLYLLEQKPHANNLDYIRVAIIDAPSLEHAQDRATQFYYNREGKRPVYFPGNNETLQVVWHDKIGYVYVFQRDMLTYFRSLPEYQAESEFAKFCPLHLYINTPLPVLTLAD